jgi:hypothetical protein
MLIQIWYKTLLINILTFFIKRPPIGGRFFLALFYQFGFRKTITFALLRNAFNERSCF